MVKIRFDTESFSDAIICVRCIVSSTLGHCDFYIQQTFRLWQSALSFQVVMIMLMRQKEKRIFVSSLNSMLDYNILFERFLCFFF